jgi:hypothetical protein
MFSHDSLLEIYQDDSAWQIALGRFMHPILIFLRGGITNPWLIGFCALIWLAASVYLVADILDIRNTISIILLSGVMVCNLTLISTNSAFLQEMDYYSLALFLSILGVWLCKKKSPLYIALGIAAMAISMGIYQAYISVAITLVMILLLKMTWEEGFCLKSVAKDIAVYYVSIIAAAVLFYIIWKIFLKIFGIWTADTYNGMAGLGDFSDTGIFSLIGMTYSNVLYYFWNPETFTTMEFRGQSMSVFWLYLLRLANIFIVLKLIIEVAKKDIKKKVGAGRIALQVCILALLPMGMNFVCIMSKGMEHTLMVYAFIMLYVLAIWLQDKTVINENSKNSTSKVMKAVTIITVGCVVWSNVVYANQVYLKKDLQENAMNSLMTRIVADIEDMDGYEPNVTPVAFVGSFENSPYIQELAGFEDILPYGMGKTTLTYSGTEQYFLKYELNVPMNIITLGELEQEDDIINMPSYPLKGSLAYVGDVLVVKISE